MDFINVSAAGKAKAIRSSLACLPCRSRHLKCDGEKPSCSRCAANAKQCHYARSRRGGLDRAALAERRRRLARTENAAGVGGTVPRRSGDVQQGRFSSCQAAEVDIPYGRRLLDGTTLSEETSDTAPRTAIRVQLDDVASDAFINAYYTNFHNFHPFIVPQKHLARLHQDPARQARLRVLIAILRLVGCIFIAGELSIPLKDHVEVCLAQTSQIDVIMVQCRLLYSMVLFWYGRETEAKAEMDTAIKLALDLQIFPQEFAWEHGGADIVLQESWRRTWWMLYILWEIETTVDLPCEESEYESGEIPKPMSLQDLDCREFAPDGANFSSIAYLIDAVRCTALALSMTPKSRSKEDSIDVIQSLMFQAHLVIHITSISLHRPFSGLKFDNVENVSSCAREPPPGSPAPESVNIHTLRVLRSAESQIRLLALPRGALALLSACKFLLKGKDFTVARGQVRLIIGCLEELGENWPRTARNVTEIQTIARHVLLLGTRIASSGGGSDSNGMPSLSSSEGRGIPGPAPGIAVGETDNFPSLDSIEGLCGWFNLDDFGLDPFWQSNC
ncbi:hypothetical protein BDW72DRAFT_214120 [Aspergillus terricola var. indicus]